MKRITRAIALALALTFIGGTVGTVAGTAAEIATEADTAEAAASCINAVAFKDRIPGGVRLYCKGSGTVVIQITCKQNLGPTYNVTRRSFISGTWYRHIYVWCNTGGALLYWSHYAY